MLFELLLWGIFVNIIENLVNMGVIDSCDYFKIYV